MKSILILKYVNKGDAVLDLCCGKGGDLAKFSNREVSRKTFEILFSRLWFEKFQLIQVGVDIAVKSLKDLINRYNEKQFSFSAKIIHCDVTTV
jgi:ubiquinone/menaquinone biosynthesis C-methylase UbiE